MVLCDPDRQKRFSWGRNDSVWNYTEQKSGSVSGAIVERAPGAIKYFGNAMQYVLHRTTARQVQLDTVLVLNHAHGKFEQFDDDG